MLSQVVVYGIVKTKWNFKLLAHIWSRSLTRRSKYGDLTWKLLLFWIAGRWGEVVATEGSTVFYSVRFVSHFITNAAQVLQKLEFIRSVRETLGYQRKPNKQKDRRKD